MCGWGGQNTKACVRGTRHMWSYMIVSHLQPVSDPYETSGEWNLWHFGHHWKGRSGFEKSSWQERQADKHAVICPLLFFYFLLHNMLLSHHQDGKRRFAVNFLCNVWILRPTFDVAMSDLAFFHVYLRNSLTLLLPVGSGMLTDLQGGSDITQHWWIQL